MPGSEPSAPKLTAKIPLVGAPVATPSEFAVSSGTTSMRMPRFRSITIASALTASARQPHRPADDGARAGRRQHVLAATELAGEQVVLLDGDE